MPQFLRKILHELIMKLIKTVVTFAPGSRHTAFVGTGSARQLCEHVARTGVRKVLVVTDKPLRELGVVDNAIAGLVDAGLEVAFYDGVLPDPTYDQVTEGVQVARSSGSEAVVAIGGGSSMDAAKLIATGATNEGTAADWLGFNKYANEPLKIYAIPTTSGTGSEATMGAVISDPVTHEKGIASGNSMLPAAVAVDADLLVGLPPHITAATGIDALTHGIEAFISRWDRGTAKEDARIAIKLIFDHLGQAYRNGSDLNARQGMAMGAYYAGLAINQVNVGNVHAIAHQIGGKYGIPHGLANALVLPHILEFCCEEAQPALAALAVVVGAGDAGESEGVLAHKFIQAVRDLRTEVGIPDKSDLIRREDHGALVDLALAEGMSYPAPRLLDRKNALAILGEITE
ncbi:MAG: iron-containing alcohol dehydrogenase [Halioglobus sp.]|nr:iron-containing alcohol dehydrogenase [Halioglobus sp.]